MKYILLFLIAFPCFVNAQNAQFVNVFIGTDGTGHTFPGPSMPFGMVQPGPDNRDHGWAYTSGYQYRDTMLLGFSQTRFSGTGINEMGDVLLLPINPNKEAYKNAYHKESEFAEPGYYRVTKKDDVTVQLTCSNRVALHHYSFPENNGQVLVDLQHGLRFLFDEEAQGGLVLESDVVIENNNTISGYCSTKNWVNRKYYFTIQFSQPFITTQKPEQPASEKAPRYVLNFLFREKKELLVKIAMSTVSVEGAKSNMQYEMPGWDFDAVRKNNFDTWNNYLNRIQIEGDQRQKELFYTALYHVLLQPSNIADADGRYRGADDIIHTAPDSAYYSTLSIWDIYRGAFPLLQIIAPEVVDGIIQSLLLHHRAAGFLPIWTAWGQDNYCMIGNHAIPMILSAYQNGFRGFDANEALRAMVITSTQSHINSDWSTYNTYGYYPFDLLDNESVSRTLESGYDDWCVATMAAILGEDSIAQVFTKRSQYYRNLFDPNTALFRGKDSRGNWRTPFDPVTATSPLNNPGDYTEANAWQYFWTPAQFDIAGMQELLGGEDAFTHKLIYFFNTEAANPNKFLGQEAMIGQYAHGNEPSHHIIYLYAFTDIPEVGQKYLHTVMNQFHNNTPDGMIGNDDCGQMSAWYVFTALGFYPVNPASGDFVLGSPQVKSASIKLPNGKTFEIIADKFSSERIYTHERFLNEAQLDKPIISFNDIQSGGTLRFIMRKK